MKIKGKLQGICNNQTHIANEYSYSLFIHRDLTFLYCFYMLLSVLSMCLKLHEKYAEILSSPGPIKSNINILEHYKINFFLGGGIIFCFVNFFVRNQLHLYSLIHVGQGKKKWSQVLQVEPIEIIMVSSISLYLICSMTRLHVHPVAF